MLCVLCFCVAASPVVRSAPQALDLKSCTGGRAGARAECGQLMVPENRTTGLGRRIPINVIVLRAEQPAAKTAMATC